MKRRVPMAPDEVEVQYIRTVLDSNPQPASPKRIGVGDQPAQTGWSTAFTFRRYDLDANLDADPYFDIDNFPPPWLVQGRVKPVRLAAEVFVVVVVVFGAVALGWFLLAR